MNFFADPSACARLRPGGCKGIPAPWLALWIAAVWFMTACGGSAPRARSDAERPQIDGQHGLAPGRFSFPRGIDVARDGRIGVVDRSGRVQILTPRGAPLRQWMLPKYDSGTPTGLIFDESDPTSPTMVLADTHNSRILRYSLDGTLLKMFGDFGGEPGQMIYPTNVAVDPHGDLYITEYGKNDRVMKFDREGRFIMQFGGFGTQPGQFQRPLALVWYPPDRLIVADTCNHRLQVFSADGKLQAVWGGVGAGLGQFNYPYDLALTADGHIVVCEYGNNRVQVLDAQGRALAVVGRAGAGPGEFAAPWGVAAMPGGDILVADTENHRLQRFTMPMLLRGGTAP